MEKCACIAEISTKVTGDEATFFTVMGNKLIFLVKLKLNFNLKN